MQLGYIQRPVAVIMITVGMVVFGLISLTRLPQELLPDLNEPTLTIETEYPDAAPKEIERLVTEPLEKGLSTLAGLKQIESFSLPGKSIIKLKFGWNHDMDRAFQEIRESLDRQTFPKKVKPSKVLRFDPSFSPIARLSFSSETKAPTSVRETLDQNIRPVLETFPGVATTIIKGGEEEEIAVLFARGTLESFGVKPTDIVHALQSENISLPTGKFEHGEKEIFVRVNAEFTNESAIGNLVIKEDQGRVTRLGDVATITRRVKEPETLTRVDAKDAIFLDVYKEADANILDVVDQLKQAIQQQLPNYRWMQGINAKIVTDESLFIRKSIDNVMQSAVLGACLATLVLYFFLGEFIPSFLIGIAIPLAIPVSFFLLDQKGISLNVMSLGGLALGIGMLVDNSIVVLENISKKAAEGLSILAQATEGTKEMLMPITASTLTTVAVFAPLAFVTGIAGQLFGDLAWAIIFSLLCSLAVAAIILPTLHVLIHGLVGAYQRPRTTTTPTKPTKPFHQLAGYIQDLRNKDGRPWWLSILLPWRAFKWVVFLLNGICIQVFVWILTALKIAGKGTTFVGKKALFPIRRLAAKCQSYASHLEADVYPRLLRKTLGRRKGVFGSVLLLGALSILLASQLGGELLPPLSQSRYFLNGELPVGTNIRTTSTTSFAFETILTETSGVTNVVALIGMDQSQALVGNAGINKFSLQFDVNPEAFDRSQLEQNLRQVEGVTWKISQPSLGISADPIEVLIVDNDMTRLREKSFALKSKLDRAPFLKPVQATLGEGVPELTVNVNTDLLLALGLTPGQVVEDVSVYLSGQEATQIDLGEQTLPVRVKASEQDVSREEDLSGIKLITKDKSVIDLGTISSIEKSTGPAFIYHAGSSRSVRLSYEPVGMSLDEARDQLALLLPENSLDTEYQVKGQSEDYDESIRSLLFAVALAVFMVYLVMASQFESFLQPLFIMGSIPLAFIGVVLLIFPFQMPISVMVLVGCIVLVGIIVNNAIIFIDTVNHLRKSGIILSEAVVETGRKRLRPILMTTVTTILGLIPMAFATGEGAALSVAMARTIIGGLGFGTLLTLVFIPVLLTMFSTERPETST